MSSPNSNAIRIKVFISYARANMASADALVAALEPHDIDVLIDRRDLPYGEEWKPELLDFVRQADSIVFVVSQRSVASSWCKWEVEQVKAHGKRLVPIELESVPRSLLPPEIGDVHILSFVSAWSDERPTAEFDTQATVLAKVLGTNRRWTKEHTRYGDLAGRWNEVQTTGAARAEAVLLRGHALEEAELWISSQPREAPQPTDLQRAYIRESRLIEQQRAKVARRRSRILVMVSLTAACIMGALGWFFL